MKNYLFLALLCLFTNESFAQCSDFQIQADKTSVCAPDIIRFNITNSVSGSLYKWNVGNGNVNGGDTFHSFFTTAQIVNAKVIITLPSGNTCIVTNDSLVTVNPKPNPQFTASEVLLCNGPDSVEFKDITPDIVERSWIIQGSNYTNTDSVVKHRFVNTGAKKVSLVVSDSKGCKGVRDFIDTIQIFNRPNFSFSLDQSEGCTPFRVNATLDKNPSISSYSKSYHWDFEGSSKRSDSSLNPQERTYLVEGKYPVSLDIEVSNGCSYSIASSDTVTVGDSTILDLSIKRDTICLGNTLDLKQTNTNLTEKLDWTVTGISSKTIVKNNEQLIINPTTRGNVTVKLSYKNNGCLSTATYTNIARVNSVKSSFSSSNNFHCKVPHTVDIVNNSNSLDASSLDYKWKIFDGTSAVDSSTNINPSFTFNKLPGFYDVQLVSTGNDGCTDTLIRKGFIYQDSLRLNFQPSPRVACVGQDVQIVNLTLPSTYVTSDSFSWTFFDKNGLSILDSSKEKNPIISYSDSGFFDIEVIGYNDIGCSDTIRLYNVVEVIEEEASFLQSDTSLCRGQSFTFEGTGTHPSTNYSYSWRIEHLSENVVYQRSSRDFSIKPQELGGYKVFVKQETDGGCISEDSTRIYVNGLEAKISLDTFSGCTPLLVSPAVDITNDKFEGFSDSTYTYFWTVKPNNGIIEQNTMTGNPSFEFTETGDYTLDLEIRNSANCLEKLSSAKVSTGVRSGFTIDDNIICLGDSLIVSDQSYNSVTDVDWEMVPYDPFTYSLSKNGSLSFKVSEPGSYVLKQIVTNNNYCNDTTAHSFEVIETIANFEAADSFLPCAPIYAEFNSKSINADTLIWDFGDGEKFTTTNSNAGTIYEKNSGWETGFNITLIAINAEGCKDTTTKEDYLVVAGPTPAFQMKNFIGCEPLKVEFYDKSTDGKTFYLNYNDGSTLDSSKQGDFIGSKNYTIQSPTLLRQTVMPSILVYDSLGCAAVFEPVDSIVIYRSPEISLVLENGSQACSPSNIVFEDTGSFTTQRNWSLDSVSISANMKDSIIEKGVGDHILELIATNSFNCSDTMTHTVSVFEKPDVSFIKNDTICLDRVTSFEGIINSVNPRDFFRWTFGEPGLSNDTNTVDLNPNFTYQSVGIKQIKLLTGLTNGCNDSTEATILVTDENDIDIPEIDYVSFVNNSELILVHKASEIIKFSNYLIADGTDDLEIYDRSKTSSTFTFSSEPIDPKCYTVSVIDHCGLRGKESMEHCFMVLQVTSTTPYVNSLSWTPYQGWSSVKEYNVYRKDENEVFVRIAKLDGLTTTYEDLGLCDQEYEYYVSAVHPQETWESKSYQVRQRPIYLKNERLSSIKNVSVVDVNSIEITWDSSDYSEFSQYKLSKYETSSNNLIDEVNLSNNYFLDKNVETDKYSYTYKIEEQDRCGYLNSMDREGSSILLEGSYIDAGYLSWNKYRNWISGVKEYNIELEKKNDFVVLVKNKAGDSTYVDRDLYRDIIGEYCYRIYAVSNANDTSLSNIVCLDGESRILMPNAFSPNSDGLNDVIYPIMFFMKEGEIEQIVGFSMSIFNRWGEKVFETNNPYEGWDGSYKGTACKQGAYVYKVSATGFDNVKIRKDGIVTIIR